jgi:hypothetical protein
VRVKNLAAPFMLAVAAGALLPAASLAAPQHAAVPVPGKATPCRASGPVILRRGSGPASPLRLGDPAPPVAPLKLHAKVVTIDARRYGDGASHVSTDSTKISGTLTPGHATPGHVPVAVHLKVTFRTGDGRHQTRTTDQHWDLGHEGTLAKLTNDGGPGEVPNARLGVGASWRVVRCTTIHELPVQVTRTYTLRSRTAAAVTLSFRDAVTIDPGRMSLGTEKDGGRLLHYRLLTLGGTASGRVVIPESSTAGARLTTVTRLHVTLQPGDDTGENVMRQDLLLVQDIAI